MEDSYIEVLLVDSGIDCRVMVDSSVEGTSFKELVLGNTYPNAYTEGVGNGWDMIHKHSGPSLYRNVGDKIDLFSFVQLLVIGGPVIFRQASYGSYSFHIEILPFEHL